MSLILNYTYFSCDAPQIEELIKLHDNIMYYLFILLFAIFWVIVSTVGRIKYINKYITCETLIELIWTISPAIILILIAFPSFKLLYLMDEITDPSLGSFIDNYSLCWSYEHLDFSLENEDEIVYDSYLVPESYLEEGKLRIWLDDRVVVLELYMNEAGEGSSNTTIGEVAIQIDASINQNRPTSDWRWFPMEFGDSYRNHQGNGDTIHRIGSIFIFNMSDPADDISNILYTPNANYHAVKRINGTYYSGRVKHLMGSDNNAPRTIAVNYNNFLNYAASHNVTSNGYPVNIDASGNVTIQRV